MAACLSSSTAVVIPRRSRAHLFTSWAFSIRKAAAASPLKALRIFSRMQRRSVPHDSFSMLFALKSCSHIPDGINITRHLHAHLLKLGFYSHVYVATSLLDVYASGTFTDACILFDEMPARNAVTWNIMITGCARQGDITAARKVFDSIPSPLRDVCSWSAMIAAYMDHRLWDNGLALFRQMTSTSNASDPDRVTLGAIFSACGRMGSVGSALGKSAHAFAIKNDYDLRLELGTQLVDMYARFGFLKNASLVFSRMKISNNVVATTALICGAAKHGYAREALQVFEKMTEVGLKPNEVTFTGILSACAQAGLLEEGRRYFRMIEQVGLRPTIEHYGCMVCLFGKAGLLGEAYEIINVMPFEPNVVIWGSFLQACKLHRQFEMAAKVIDKVVRVVKPQNDGGLYSQIRDIYVLSGKWDEADRMSKLMVRQNVRKVRTSRS